MNLLETLDDLLQGWRPAFAQMRTFTRARRLTFGLLVCMRRHLTSQAICATGQMAFILSITQRPTRFELLQIWQQFP